MRHRRLLWGLVWLLIFAIGLTPYYLLALVLAIGVTAYPVPLSAKFFASYTARLAASFLLVCSVAMSVAMYCWLVKIAVQPIFVLLPIAVVWFWFSRRGINTRGSRRLLINKEDVLAIGLAGVGIALLLASFYLPRPSLADSIQLITNGYDNSAHLLMIDTTYQAKGYVYGPYAHIKSQIISATLNGYPQGWHFVNAFFWRGTGEDIFGGGNASAAINLYVVSLLMWQFVALYLFAKASMIVMHLFRLRDKLFRAGPLAAFCAANLLLQLVVFWGALDFGFAPFIAALAYFMLLIVGVLSLLEERDKGGLFVCFVVALLCTTAIGLSWLLPAPAALLTIALAFAPLLPNKPWRSIRKYRKSIVAYGMVLLVGGIPLVAQVLINKLYSTEGVNQINDNGGIYGVSDTLAIIVISFAAFTAIAPRTARLADRVLSGTYMAIASPLLLLTGAIFVYQIFSAGQTAYFFTKTLSLALVVGGVFFVAGFVKLMNGIEFSSLNIVYAPLLAVTAIITLLFATGQTTLNFNTLFQRYSNVSYNTASQLATLAQNGTLRRSQVIVFRQASWNEDVIGSVLATYTPHRINQCMSDADWVIISRRPQRFAHFVSLCTRNNQQVTILASPASDKLLPRDNPHIHIIVVN